MKLVQIKERVMHSDIVKAGWFSNWVCPKCKGDLKVEDGAYFCEPCGHRFTNSLGLPDFRLHYQDSENQIALAKEFRQNWGKLTYEDMVRLRVAGLRQRALAAGKSRSNFDMWNADEQAHLATFEVRGKHYLCMLKNVMQGKNCTREIARLVDVGCGWGRDLLHLACLAKEVIGVDVSAFSLLMTKKLLEERRVTNVTLVLAEGESLPLAAKSIDGFNSSATIEHIPEPGDFLRECSRCLSESGWVFLYYPNRFSLLPETHTGIWGLGYLSVARQNKVVQRKLGHEWNTILFSKRSFMRMLKSTCSYTRIYITGIPPGIENFLLTSKFWSLFPRLARVSKCVLPIVRSVPGFERLASFFCPVHFVFIAR